MCGELVETPICQLDLNEDEVLNKEIVAIFLLGRLHSGDNHRVSVSQGVLTNCGESQWPFYRPLTNGAQVFLSSSGASQGHGMAGVAVVLGVPRVIPVLHITGLVLQRLPCLARESRQYHNYPRP